MSGFGTSRLTPDGRFRITSTAEEIAEPRATRAEQGSAVSAVAEHDDLVRLDLDPRRHAGACRMGREVLQQAPSLRTAGSISPSASATPKAPAARANAIEPLGSGVTAFAASACADVMQGHLTCTKWTSLASSIRA